MVTWCGLGWAPAARGQAIVLRSDASYQTGERLAADATISIGEGQRMLVLHGGRTRVLCGPTSIPVRSLASSDTCERHLVGPDGRRRTAGSRSDGFGPNSISVRIKESTLGSGSAASGTASAPEPPICIVSWESLSFRWSSKQQLSIDGVPLTRRGSGYRASAPWPTVLPQVSGREYQLSLGPDLPAKTLVHIDTADPQAALEEMLRRGCPNDITRLSGTFPHDGVIWENVPKLE